MSLERTSAKPSEDNDVFGKGTIGNHGQTKYPVESQPASTPHGTKAKNRGVGKGVTGSMKIIGKRGGGGASAAFLEASARWRAHLAEYRKAHPNMSLKQQMKGAKKTYKKSKSQPISVRNTRYSVQVRPRTRKAGKRNKRPKKRTSRKKRSFFGF